MIKNEILINKDLKARIAPLLGADDRTKLNRYVSNRYQHYLINDIKGICIEIRDSSGEQITRVYSVELLELKEEIEKGII